MTIDPGTPAAPRSTKTNGLAIAAIVCSALSLLTCCIPNVGPFVCIGLAILGVILGFVAMGQIKRTGEQGYGLALAGAIIGGIITVIMIILLIMGVAVGAWLMQNMNQGPGMNVPGAEDVIIDEELGEPGEVEPSIDVEPVPDATEVDPEGGSSIDATNESDTAQPEPAFE